MLVLLTDGSGLTARQTATLLSRAGHRVEALSPDPRCLCRFTRHVRRIHPVPAYGVDPFDWLDAALDRYAHTGADILLPTQEQVAVLSCAADRLAGAGVRTVVPPFEALARVQDKVSASATLDHLGLPQPPFQVIRDDRKLTGWENFPVYLKLPVGTATSGVRLVTDAHQLRTLPDTWATAAGRGGLLAQQPVDGPLVMVQSVFDHGAMVAHHAAVRTRLGSRGGASHKRSVTMADLTALTEALGRGLRWHGALSADVILGPAGPVFIDINPRLVEPVNAARSGVDLIAPLLDLATGHKPPRQAAGRPDTATHQLLLAVLGAAQHGGRRPIAGHLARAALGRGEYRASTEELTPLRSDPVAALPVAIAAATTLIRPATWQRFASSSVDGYALTREGWQLIRDRHSALSTNGPTGVV
ncbi:hypothetical protein [Virgisporangium aurantiacum]|uniref:Carboxylate--amine ligase n=1 Tax=Virgisporangium aurantiacum TaxID=175570 RepID=A0A8J3Z0Y4_9ACTN|nr:hypothetical protein [Virgisporangium aurantiacum]GIJ54467.1 carboxylate--amine ligase [Virgisporangium aurantiacum]